MSVLEEAKEIADYVLIHQPGNTSAHYIKGRAYLLENKFEDAVKELRNVVVARPNLLDTHFNLALALEGNKNIQQVDALASPGR